MKEGADDEICFWPGGGGRGEGHLESNSFCLQENVGGGNMEVDWGGRVVQATYMHPIDSSFIMNEIFFPRKFP